MSELKFLVVDDSVTIRRIIMNTLKTIGYADVIEACHGKDALEKIAGNQVGFIITDWNMPEMNGLEFTRSVRANGSTAEIPILMITTRGTEGDVVEALQAKVSSYIVKPFTPQELKDKIENIMKTAPLPAGESMSARP